MRLACCGWLLPMKRRNLVEYRTNWNEARGRRIEYRTNWNEARGRRVLARGAWSEKGLVKPPRRVGSAIHRVSKVLGLMLTSFIITSSILHKSCLPDIAPCLRSLSQTQWPLPLSQNPSQIKSVSVMSDQPSCHLSSPLVHPGLHRVGLTTSCQTRRLRSPLS
jgi:hypothetical protein